MVLFSASTVMHTLTGIHRYVTGPPTAGWAVPREADGNEVQSEEGQQNQTVRTLFLWEHKLLSEITDSSPIRPVSSVLKSCLVGLPRPTGSCRVSCGNPRKWFLP